MFRPVEPPRSQHQFIDTPQTRCAGCGYDLTGLAASGRCPECGVAFDRERPEKYSSRPLGRWFLLLLPAAIQPLAWLAAMWVSHSGGGLVALAIPAIALIPILPIALRLARWRYSAALRNEIRNGPIRSRKTYALEVAVVLVILQLLACGLAFLIFLWFVPTLKQFGMLPASWWW
jgi:hypothetical protein